MNIFPGYKTYIVVAVGLITVIAQFLTGDATLQEATNQALVLLGVAGLRNAI